MGRIGSMKNALVSTCFTGLLLVAPSTALANPVAQAMGNLRWGMSDSEVVSVVKGALKKEYAAKLKKARGASKEMLKSEFSRRLKAFESSLEEFKGRSRWDRTPIGEEYTHGNDESMMVLEGEDYNNYYFFMDGRLWKWVRTLPARSFGDYKKFSRSIQKKFGQGYEKQGETNPGSGREYRFIEYLNRNSRLRAVDRSSQGQYALVFEDMATVRNLSALRPGSVSRKPRRTAAVVDDAKPERSDERAAPAAEEKRSVFSKDKRSETDTEYEARRKRVLDQRERAERAKYERKEAAKKAKALDGLKGLEDDDPLAGVH